MDGIDKRNAIVEVGKPRDLLKVVAPALAAIPIVGGTLSATWSEFNTDGRIKRVEETLGQIKELLSNDYQLNAFAATPAGMQLLESVLHRVEVQVCKQKRVRFANLVASSWLTDDPVESIFDESMMFAEATERFSESHLLVLMQLYNLVPGQTLSFKELKPVGNDDPTGLLIVLLNCLCSTFHFVRRGWGMDDPAYKGKLLTGKGLSPENIALRCQHAITPRGRRYIDYVVKGPSKLCTDLT